MTRLTLTLDDRSAARLKKLAAQHCMPPGVVASLALLALHELVENDEETERLKAIKQQFQKGREGSVKMTELQYASLVISLSALGQVDLSDSGMDYAQLTTLRELLDQAARNVRQALALPGHIAGAEQQEETMGQ